MKKLTIGGVVFLLLGIGLGGVCEAQIEPTWVKEGVDWSQYQKFLVKP